MQIPAGLPAPTPAETVEGKQAIGEAAAIAADVDLSDRQKIKDFNDLIRAERRDMHVHNVTVCGIWVAGIAVLIMFLVLVTCYVLPSEWRFLQPAEITQLQTFLFSGVIGGVITKVSARVFPGEKKSSNS